MNLNDFLTQASKKEEYLKLLLTGPSGTGKTSSIIYGCPKPLLVFDLEKGASQYSKVSDFILFENKKVAGFDETDPKNILWFVDQLLETQANGHKLPFKSILLDSGTVLYNRIMDDYLKELRADGDPNKRKLEPNEYAFPKNTFYEIIRKLKRLDVHVFITAHASDNYLKGAFMKIDPNEPIKPDCEKRLVHEMDVHYILSKSGKKYKATLKKSRIVDKDGKVLLAPTIDNFSNFDFIPMLVEMMNKDKGYDFEGDEEVAKNTIRTDNTVAQQLDNIREFVSALQLAPAQFKAMVKEETGKENIYELDKEQVNKVYAKLRDAVENMSGGTGE